jgi:hypothetical protein
MCISGQGRDDVAEAHLQRTSTGAVQKVHHQCHVSVCAPLQVSAALNPDNDSAAKAFQVRVGMAGCEDAAGLQISAHAPACGPAHGTLLCGTKSPSLVQLYG